MAFRNLPEMPCGPILELHGQRKRFHVPYGLKRLIEEMTREVLRFQPENIYEFLAAFMEARLQRKLAELAKNQKRKSWEQHRWSYQGESVLEPEELKEFLETLPAPAEQVNHHAVVIQAAFRGYQARKKVKEIRKSIDEDVKRKTLMMGGEGGKEGEDDGEYEEGQQKRKRTTIDITAETATEQELKSAIVIQSAFRGMHARKEIKKKRASIAEERRKSEYQERRMTEDFDQEQEVPPLENAEQPAEAVEGDHPVEVAEVSEASPQSEAPAITEEEAPAAQVPETEPVVSEPPAGESAAPPEEGEVPVETETKEGEQQQPVDETKPE